MTTKTKATSTSSKPKKLKTLAEVVAPKATPEKYPPPRDNTTFVEKWKLFLPDILKRVNFKQGHLSQLSILCSLYVEYEKLEDNINTNGYSYTTDGKGGYQEKIRPEVIQLNRTRGEIRNYSKILGLVLVKDNQLTDQEEEKSEWS